MFCPCLRWRMNNYRFMFLGFNYHISIIWEISSEAVPLRKTRALIH